MSPGGHSQSSLLSSLRQRSVAVMNSRYLLSMSSKMCFLSRLTASGTYSWLFRSASSLEHTCTGIYLVFIYIFQLVRNLWNQQEDLAHKRSLESVGFFFFFFKLCPSFNIKLIFHSLLSTCTHTHTPTHAHTEPGYSLGI